MIRVGRHIEQNSIVWLTTSFNFVCRKLVLGNLFSERYKQRQMYKISVKITKTALIVHISGCILSLRQEVSGKRFLKDKVYRSHKANNESRANF